MKSLNSSTRKFCILTTQRSGSTWLKELLDSHPDVKVLGEIFLEREQEEIWEDDYLISLFKYRQQKQGFNPLITLDYLEELNHYPGNYKVIGFKLMYDQLAAHPLLFLQIIINNFKILHLTRENHLDIAFSKIIARTTNVYHSRVKINSNQQYVNPSDLIKEINKHDTKLKIAKSMVKVLPNSFLNVTYESLCEKPQETLTSIAKFLNISNCYTNYKSDLKPINSGKYREKIVNFDEIQEAILSTRFKQLLPSK